MAPLLESLEAEYTAAFAEHPSLIRIVDREFNDPFWNLGWTERLVELGLGDFAIIEWGMKRSDGYNGNIGDGGSVVAIRRGDEIRTMVYLKMPRMSGNVFAHRQLAADWLAVFFHELGHVDDFGNAVHLVPGKTVDAMAAELYAHRYACRRLARPEYRFALFRYLIDLIAQSAVSPCKSIADAARRFSDSAVYLDHVQFAHDNSWKLARR